MKTTLAILLAFTFWMHPEAGLTNDNPGDTVIIELNNKSKLVIYTESRTDLEDLQQYDLNKMIKDLNSALSSSKIRKIELEDEHGNKYLKDTTLVIGTSSAKTRVKIGNMELLIDADEWEDLEEEWDDDVPVKKYSWEEQRTDRTRNYFNVDFGLNNWMEGSSFPDETGQLYAVRPWGSWYIGLNSVNKTWIAGPLSLEWGGGISWYNWKMENADVMIRKGSERVEFIDTTGFNTVKSKLTVPYINVAFIPVLDFGRGTRKVKDLERGSVHFRTYKKQGLRVGLGGYAGYRIGGHSKFVYRVEGKKEKDREHNNFYLQNFRYGIRAQVGFKGLELFATYDLNEVFAEGKGPAGSNGLNAITFGITL